MHEYEIQKRKITSLKKLFALNKKSHKTQTIQTNVITAFHEPKIECEGGTKKEANC
jgi:hypothetical protein